MGRAIVVMGVSASGKSTIGAMLADRIGAAFVEGDSYHSEQNRARMARGEPLDDGLRAPWLDLLASTLREKAREGHVVLACSALKRAYRDLLRRGAPDLIVVYPDVPRPLAEARIGRRKGHYMPASLLGSQYATLEPPGPEEAPIAVDGALAPAEAVEAVVAALEARGAL